jgi:3-oxoacyl-[acyl-carrier-protein] synthase II
MSDAHDRGARIYGEVIGWAINSDASDFVLPNPDRQAQCMQLAMRRAGIAPDEVHIVSSHATGTTSGDVQECQALRSVFGGSSCTRFNNTKSYIGHAMGAAGALELAGNLPAFNDGACHPTINLEQIDPDCRLEGLIVGDPRELPRVEYLLNNSFGMLGINSAVVIKKV